MVRFNAVQTKESLNIAFCTYRYLDMENGTVDFGNCDNVDCAGVERDVVENRMVADHTVHILAPIEIEVQMVDNGRAHYEQICRYDAHYSDGILYADCVTFS